MIIRDFGEIAVLLAQMLNVTMAFKSDKGFQLNRGAVELFCDFNVRHCPDTDRQRALQYVVEALSHVDGRCWCGRVRSVHQFWLY